MSEKDLTMMLAAHQAFRRDLRHLVAKPSLERWQRFSKQLSIHHTSEDTALWPRMRRRGADSGLLDAMEAEHGQIDPLLRKVADAFAAKAPAGGHLKALAELLDNHLKHEEAKVLPIITDQEWSELDREFRRRIGIRGIRPYFTWVLEDAPADLRAKVLKALPAPIRLALGRNARSAS